MKKMILLLTSMVSFASHGSENTDQLLLKAAEMGDLALVQKALNQNAAINCENSDRETPLMLACLHGHDKIVAYLLNAGAGCKVERGVNKKVYPASGNSQEEPHCLSIPLAYACKSKNPATIALLLDAGAEVEEFYSPEYNLRAAPLEIAAKYSTPEVLDLLLQKPGKNSLHPHSLQNLMFAAFRENNLNIVFPLTTEYGVDINSTLNKKTLLQIAIENDDLIQARELISRGGELSIYCSNASRPLFFAARNGACRILEYYLQEGADVNQRDGGGHTLLIEACKNPHRSAVKTAALLLDWGADKDLLDSADSTAIDRAFHTGNLELVTLLLSRGAHFGAQIKLQKSHTDPALMLDEHRVTALERQRLLADFLDYPIECIDQAQNNETQLAKLLFFSIAYNNLEGFRYIKILKPAWFATASKNAQMFVQAVKADSGLIARECLAELQQKELSQGFLTTLFARIFTLLSSSKDPFLGALRNQIGSEMLAWSFYAQNNQKK